MKKLAFLFSLLVCPVALAAGPGANCPAATNVGNQCYTNTDGGPNFYDAGYFCDGGSGPNGLQQYFQVACNLNNPIALTADPVQPDIYFATEGTYDGGKYNDGVIYALPIDGGVLKKLSPATQACPISITADGTNVIWVNSGSSCSFTDAGTLGQNALIDAPWDGGTNVVLVAGYQGIRHVASDGTYAYFSGTNQTGNNPAIGFVQSVLLDAGASYPVTTLWTSASGTAMVNGQLCTWTNGLATCPALGVANQAIGNTVGNIAVANGTIFWGPYGMSMPTNGSQIPVAYGASLPGPEKSVVPFDAGIIFTSGTGIQNMQGHSLATNGDQYYGALATDQTTLFFPCNSQPNGTVGVCSTPFLQTVSYPVQIAGEFVAPPSSNKSFSETAAAAPVYNATYVMSISSAVGSYPIAADNDAGLLLATTTVLPSGFPTVLDGGIVYSTGKAFINLSGPLPAGYNLISQYTGTTVAPNIPNQTLFASGLPGISGMVVDILGNLDWVSPNGIDAGFIMMLQPK